VEISKLLQDARAWADQRDYSYV